MLKGLAYLLIIALFVETALAETQLAEEDVCKVTTCREGGIAQVWLDENRYMEIPLDGTVIAHETNISIFPGEDYVIESDLVNGQIANLRPLFGQSQDALIRVSFTQEFDGDGSIQSLLKVKNPFKYPLRYEVYISTGESDEFHYTSSCPVQPGLVTFEHWPYPIVHVVMTGVRLLKDHDAEGAITCE